MSGGDVIAAVIIAAALLSVIGFGVYLYMDQRKFDRESDERMARHLEYVKSDAFKTESRAEWASHFRWHRMIATMPQEQFDALIDELSTPVGEEGTH